MRAARAGDARAVAALVFKPAAGMYAVFGGGHDQAIALLARAFGRSGNAASREVTTVAELDGQIAGAMTAFPATEAEQRERRWFRLALRSAPPWRWPRMIRVQRIGAAQTPDPPRDSLYIDALATDERFRRRGVARALLDEAARQASERGLRAVSLDTSERNDAAQALYEDAGFRETARLPARGQVPGIVAYVRQLEDRA